MSSRCVLTLAVVTLLAFLLAPAPAGAGPDPTLLPVATTTQGPLTSSYNTLNVTGRAAGSTYLDPTTGVKIYKLTSATFPTANSNWGHDYSEGGYEVSLPYNGSTRAVLVRQNGSQYWLVDFTPGAGVTNPRSLAGTGMAPFMDLAFTFSNNPTTPYFAYVSNGTAVRRFDFRTLTEVPGDGWPVQDASAAWLHQSENDSFFVWMLGANGSTVVGYEPSTRTRKTYTNANLNEPRIDRSGRYVGISMNSPANGLVVWDWLTNTVPWTTSGDPGIPFAHNASLRGRWVVVDWNVSFPDQFAMFTGAVANSGVRLVGPALSTTVHGNGNWIQHPTDLNDQWALFLHYGSLVPTPTGSGWLAPGGMVFMTPNGQRRLLGHAYNTTADYTYFSFAKLTADGQYVLFTSDMNGSARSDVFLAEVPQTATTGDTTPPTVAVTAPISGTTVVGTVAVAATASDNVGVVGVQFKLDGVNRGAEVTVAPYAISWITTTALNGAHTLTAVARDAAGNTATSTSVSVTVLNTVLNPDTTPPSVSLAAPAAGATVSGTVTVAATATDNVGVAGVQFKLDGANLGAEDTVAPFAVSWNTTTATNGAHTLTAVARDAAGNTTTSALVSVTVSNTTGGSTVSAQNVAWTNVVNATATGNSLTKTSGCDGCDDAGATSQQQIASGDGYAEFTATETTALRVAGLTHAFTVTNLATIDFGIRLQSGVAEVRENDVYRTDATFAAGDVFRVAVTAGVVRYSKNGAVFYTSTAVPTYPLFLAAALASLNGTISNAVITAAVPDTTPPSVSVTAPTAGATVSGTLSVAATATDNVRVVGVQFKLDGANLGVEVTVAPYAVAWNTAMVIDGAHTLTAVARDAAGNSTTSAAVTVTVNNDATPPTISAVTASAISASGATITWTTNELGDSQVEYGLTTAYGNSTALDTSAVTAHSQGLSGTAGGTVYHFRVKSRDAAGNLAVSGDFTFATPATSDPSVVMVGSWTLDEGSGTTAGDSSGNGNTGSLINGPTWTVGNLGGALAFDGTSQYVNVPHTPALNPYPLTVAVWIKTSTASGVRGVANKYVAGSYNGYNVFLSNGNLCAWYLRDPGNYVYDGSGCPFNVPGYNDNQWHHVAYVVDAAGGRLYVDGLEKGSLGWTGTAGAPTTTQPVQLGHYPGAFGGAEYFAGSLDDVRIYNRTLSATEILALYNLAGPSNSPELPRVVLDTTYTAPTGGTLRTVNAGGDLQAALNVAQPGDVITLEAGATFTGNYTLPNKSGTGWIIIRTSASDASLPPPGTRITPAYAAVLPKVVSPNSAAAIATVAGAHHYRLIGLEVTIGAGVTSNTGVGGLVQLGDWSTQTTLDQVPHDIILDRVYVHGSPTVPLRRCIALHSAATAVIDSYISDAHHQTFDAQAIAGWNGPGPFKIVNNYLEGSGENLMFGGADPAITNLVPSDIEIRGNHFFKPLTWKSDDRSYAGINWSVKNLFELKNAQRVLADGNIFENNWVAAQNGFAILFTPRNQDGTAPWSVVQDVTFTHNIVRHSASAIVTHGTDTIHTITQQTTRILVKDNVFDDIGTAQWGRWTYPGTGFLFYTGAANVTIDHNTLFNTGPAVYGDISANSGFVYRNNTSPYNIGTADYELCCSGVIDNIDGIGGRDTTGNANLTLSTYFPGAVFARNVLAGGGSSSNWPVDNFFPATLDAVGFVNPTGGDYHLSTTSLYKNAGTDGKDLGADIDALDAATACAFDGACTSTPPPPTVSITAPTAGSTVAGTVTVTADASDNVGVAGVQFKLDGDNLGAEVTSAPYAISWNTTTAPNGAHTLTALARDAAGNVATSAGVDVTVANDVTASVISGLTVSSITSSGATILWTTNEPSDTQVEYGVTTAYGSVTPLKASLVTSHSQALSGLAPRTWYHYRVQSRDAAGNLAVSGDFTFKTKVH